MTATLTPIADATDVGETIGGKFHSRDLLFDSTGADAMGLVTTSPAANTLLGRLKAIVDALTAATYFPATQPVSGNVGVTGTVAVTGSFYQATQPVSVTTLPLPTGAATAAGVTAVVTALGTPMQQTGGTVGVTGTVAVTGTFFQATQPVSIAAPVAVTGTFFQTTQPVSATALPLPAGAATSAKQDALQTSVDLTTPANTIFAITPGVTILSTIPKALMVTVAGTLSVGDASNTPVSLGSVTVGQIIPLRARYVYSSGTTATVVGLA